MRTSPGAEVVTQRAEDSANIEIRAARVEDAARIAEIHVRAWQAAYRGIMAQRILDGLSIPKREAFWEERLTSDASTVLVAVRGTEIIGWLVYGSSRDDDARPAVREVYGLYVDPLTWRSGAGRLLWNEARRRLAAASIGEVTLWVLAANERARSFYEAIGFRREPGPVRTLDRDGQALEEVRYRARL